MNKIRNIKQLAELARVSTGTVSRALAGSELISQKTRERIQALAREHGFRPNLLARNLRIQRTGAIGVLIPLGHEKGQHISEPFFITMLGLLADKLTERGYDLLLSRVIPTDGAWLDHMAGSGRVDGIIVIGQSDQAAVIDAVAQTIARWWWGGIRKGRCIARSVQQPQGRRYGGHRLIEQAASASPFSAIRARPKSASALPVAAMPWRARGWANPRWWKRIWWPRPRIPTLRAIWGLPPAARRVSLPLPMLSR
jgi:hypothetical protein